MIQDAERHGGSAHAIESEESPRAFISARGSPSSIGALINVVVHFVVLQVLVKITVQSTFLLSSNLRRRVADENQGAAA